MREHDRKNGRDVREKVGYGDVPTSRNIYINISINFAAKKSYVIHFLLTIFSLTYSTNNLLCDFLNAPRHMYVFCE